jgi:hypothetical protein
VLVVDREVKLVPSEFPAHGKNPTIGSSPSAYKQTPMTDLGELAEATIHPRRCATEIIETSSLPTLAKTCDIALRYLLASMTADHDEPPSPPFLLLFGQAFIEWRNPKFLDQKPPIFQENYSYYFYCCYRTLWLLLRP